MAEAKQKTGAKPSKRVLDPKKMKKRNVDGEPTKEEYAVAKFVRFKCPTKKTQFGHGVNGEEVAYFVGSKAVDCLMESKWSSTGKKASKKNQPLFTDRQTCVDYMQQLLMKGLFFRAKKLVPKIKEKPSNEGGEKTKKGDQAKKGNEAKEEQPKSPKATKETEVKRRKKDKGEKEDEDKGDKDKQKDKDDENENEKGKGKSSKARKVKLDWHNEQLFIDGQSIYVWKYDPTPLKTWLLGLGIVLGAIALCLFPLWPTQIRIGVYYLSSGALVFFGAFFGFILLRTVLFGIIWAVTLGRHHLWLFPNLTEDCGVMESFRPYYSYKYVPSGSKSDDDKEKKKSKKSDSEDEGEVEGEGEGGVDDEDIRESKDSQEGDGRGSESESENENEDEQGKDVDSAAASQDDIDDYDDKSEDSSNERSVRTSTDEEPAQASKEQAIKPKRRAVRRDDGQESSVNGDFEIVENPKND